MLAYNIAFLVFVVCNYYPYVQITQKEAAITTPLRTAQRFHHPGLDLYSGHHHSLISARPCLTQWPIDLYS